MATVLSLVTFPLNDTIKTPRSDIIEQMETLADMATTIHRMIKDKVSLEIFQPSYSGPLPFQRRLLPKLQLISRVLKYDYEQTFRLQPARPNDTVVFDRIDSTMMFCSSEFLSNYRHGQNEMSEEEAISTMARVVEILQCLHTDSEDGQAILRLAYTIVMEGQGSLPHRAALPTDATYVYITDETGMHVRGVIDTKSTKSTNSTVFLRVVRNTCKKSTDRRIDATT
jgi:hypothetical protein